MWIEDNTALLPDPKNIHQLIKITLNLDKTFKKEIIDNFALQWCHLMYLDSMRTLIGGSPTTNVLFAINGCYKLNEIYNHFHYHDQIRIWKNNLCFVVNMEGIAIEHTLDDSHLYVMTLGNTDSPLKAEPIDYWWECKLPAGSYEDYPDGPKLNHFWKYYSFVRIDLISLEVDYLTSKLPVVRHHFDNVPDPRYNRFGNLGKANRLSSNKDFLIFQSDYGTYFLCKNTNFCFRSHESADQRVFSHPSKPIECEARNVCGVKYEFDFYLSETARDLNLFKQYPATRDGEYVKAIDYTEIK